MSDEAPAGTPRKKNRSRLLVIALATLLLAGGAVGATWYMAGAGKHEGQGAGKPAPAKKPLYTTLENFTVNLQDDRGERFAQVGITLQFEEADVEVRIRDGMPAIRNEILMLLSSKRMEELLSVEGKKRLAAEVRERAALAMGVAPAPGAASAAANPIRGVLFSQFIIQ